MKVKIEPPKLTGLYKDKCVLNVPVKALKVPPSACAYAMKHLGPYLLNIPRVKSIVSCGKERLILFESENPTIQEYKDKVGGEWTEYNLVLDYDYWNADQILRAILPDDIQVPNAFETIGHIAHFNLRPEHMPYKELIGQVVLDKSRHIRTVVSKVDSIDHTYRFFKMQVLAGEDDMMAHVRECDCDYYFDFSKVYWNSRLQGEHSRLVSLFKKGDFICDAFAGVGPFAIPAAKKGCYVYANDLNPMSFEFLEKNIIANKVTGRVNPFNMDARQFIQFSLQDLNNEESWNEWMKKWRAHKVKKNLEAVPSFEARTFDHYIMNLPATATEFLDAFQGLLSKQQKLPMIHCYCFSRSDDPKDGIVMVEKMLGQLVNASVHHVRTVAPNKNMLCVSFELPATVAYKRSREE